MNLGGWIFMGISVAFVWVWTIACYVAVFRAPPEDGKGNPS